MWRNSKVGTPENPEIIEPGAPRPAAPRPNRFWALLRILAWMVSLSLPALALDWLCLWLLRMGGQPGGWPAYLMLIFFAPPAFTLTLVALLANAILGVAFFLTLIGRSVQLPHQTVRFRRFVSR